MTDYICDLTLPGNAPFSVIRIKAEKLLARMVAARDACEKLIKMGELDENLAPLRVPGMTPKTYITSSSWKASGEAFLKFFWGAYYFALHQDDLEGTLTTRVQNKTRRVVLSEYLVSSGLPQNVCTNPGRTEYGINRIAEITRRVIGAAVIHGGVDTAMEVTRALGVRVDASLASISSIRIVHQLNRVVDLDVPITVYNARKIQKVQEALKYQFKDTQLLLEVMAHKNAKAGISYERLEFLRDAVLEIVAAEHYYRECPDAPLESFRQFKSQILSNNALGSLLVSLNLDHVIFGSGKVSLKNGAARAKQFKSNKETA